MDKTSQKIDTLISGFKNVVAYLLTQGFDVNSAIDEAYKLYPVMDGMKESIADDMVKAFTSGYINAGVAVGVDTGTIPYTSESISTAMQKAWAKDNLNLSTRLHTRGQVVRKEVGDILKATIGKGNTNKKIASELFNRGVIDTADLPQFMEQVANLPIDTSAEEKRKLLRKVQRQVSKRTTAGLRAGYSEVIKAVESDNQKKLDKAIEIATEEKTRYHAERIARTETARAYADGQVSRYKDDDDIVAFQWKLGTRHPVFDICDFYANADLYGMGKGIYPKDKAPTLPAHPHCMCRLKPIVDGMIDNSTPKENINDGGMDLIKRLSVKEQERLLGVYGRLAVLEGKARWQDHLRGWDDEWFRVRTPNVDMLNQPVTRGDRKKIKPMKHTMHTAPYMAEKTKIHGEMINHVNKLPVDDKLKKAIYDEIQTGINAVQGKDVERVGIIDTKTGKLIYEKLGIEHDGKVPIHSDFWDRKNKNSTIIIHNHPNNTGFSRGDIYLFLKRNAVKGGVVYTGLGDLYYVGGFKGNRDHLANLFEFLYNKNINSTQLEAHEVVALVLKEMDKKKVLRYVEQTNKQ
ncbi:hypothetical protein [Veillonella sp. VA142]|uniref:hypothetical protein n=1 Tax=Veillonella sp. VA142 TaxID=741834 RepID=UPI000F8E9ED4|nr:hypothetical protein [Veillonella sp. VA142]